jgi:hypothetical protein
MQNRHGERVWEISDYRITTGRSGLDPKPMSICIHDCRAIKDVRPGFDFMMSYSNT